MFKDQHNLTPTKTADGSAKRFEVSIANTQHELYEVFRLREQVLSRENSYMSRQKLGMLFDCYDFLPSTNHLILKSPVGQIVGSTRITAWHAEANPAAESYNFEAFVQQQVDLTHLPNTLHQNSYDIGRLVISKSVSGLGLGKEIFKAGCRLAVELGGHYLTAVANPEIVHLWVQCGLKPVAEEAFCLKSRLPFVPIIGDRSQLETRLTKSTFNVSPESLKKSGIDTKIQQFTA